VSAAANHLVIEGNMMNALIVLLVIIALIAAVIWVLRGKRGPVHHRRSVHHAAGNADNQTDSHANTPTTPGGLEKLKANSMFWGVEIGQAGCQAAQALLGRQYTFDEAPQLPLQGCDSAMCSCQYKGLKDHRSKHRRKSGERRVEVRFDNENPDRRSRKDRRRGANWKDHTY
jgi:hypothetical protein